MFAAIILPILDFRGSGRDLSPPNGMVMVEPQWPELTSHSVNLTVLHGLVHEVPAQTPGGI